MPYEAIFKSDFIIFIFKHLRTCTAKQFQSFSGHTYDGSDDEIKYTVTWNSWDQPIAWRFSISSNSKEIYRHSVDNDSNIINFGDPGYVDNCSGVIECRRKWFLNDLFESIVVIIEKQQPRHANVLNTSEVQAVPYYKTNFNLSDQEATDSTNRMAEFLRSRDIIGFSVPDSPVSHGALMTYDPYNKTFIPLYQP